MLTCFSFLQLSAQPDDGDDSGTTQQDPDKKVDKKVQKAYDAYNGNEFAYAIDLLKKALTEVRGRDDKAEISFMIAESYKNIQDYKNAGRYYQRAVKLDDDKYKMAQLYFGDMLMAQGEYEEALVEYKAYKKLAPSDPLADEAIESVDKAVKWKDEPSRYTVNNMKVINSRSRDFGVTFGGKMRENDVLIFTSNRDEATGGSEDGWTGEEFMDLFITTAERKGRGRRSRGASEDDDELVNPADLKWSTPVLLDEEFVNTRDHEGMAAYDSRKKELFITRCVRPDGKEEYICGIYITKQQGVNWAEPERIIIGTDTMANVGQPSLSPDDKYLYFVSDEFNTKGEHDIFMTTYDRRAKAWATPKNLGPAVNTSREEYYPFMHDDGYLYFSSDGLPGMGGQDIFRIKMGENGLPEPGAKSENMRSPINSNKEDFGLVFQPGGDQIGYLSSNRDNDNDDLYSVMKTPLVFNLQGVITSSKDGTPVPEATIRLEGSDGTSIVQTADRDGYYIFDKSKINADVQYQLTFEKKKFLSNTSNTTTVGVPLTSFEYIPSDNQFLNTLTVNKVLDPIEVPIVLPDVFFDLNKAFIRPEAKVALDSVVNILNTNPNIVIEMRSHTDYRGTDAANNDLSQRRADSTVAYLIKREIDSARLVARGMGETEPFVIPDNYKGYGAGEFTAGTTLTEKYINTLSAEKQEIANQINRRTDFKVLRDDYVPANAKAGGSDAVDPRDIINDKQNEEAPPGEIYTLKNRESLGVVARKFGINIRDLKSLNGGLKGVRPFEGMQLKVEKDGDYTKWDETYYQVQFREDSFKEIARKLDMDDDTLEDLNPDISDRDLKPGLWLKIQ
jgi:peptidoglycan-associated lipoprotein